MDSKLQARVDLVGLGGEVLAEGLEGVDSFLQLPALCNDVPLWVLLFDQVLNVIDLSFNVSHF